VADFVVNTGATQLGNFKIPRGASQPANLSRQPLLESSKKSSFFRNSPSILREMVNNLLLPSLESAIA
jgi:hypothetical protein